MRDPSRYLVNGRRVPSVTRILGLTGWSRFDGIPPDTLRKAAERGRQVHEATELVDEGAFHADLFPEEWLPYVQAYERFLRDCRPKLLASEEIVVNLEHRYAGTLDRRFEMRGEPWLLDIKTSAAVGVAAGLQLAAYEACLEAPHKRAVLHLRKDGTYRLVLLTDPSDRRLFIMAAATVNAQRDRGVLDRATAEE